MTPKRRVAEDADIGDIRLRSRQSYLAKRETEQLALLRRQVAEEKEEEERLGDRLSKQELADFRKHRETLRLAEERNAIDEHRDGYILPDADYSNKSEVLTRKHKDADEYKSEVQIWEDAQLGKINSQAKRPERTSVDEFEYIFDEQQSVLWDKVSRIEPEKSALTSMLDAAEKKAQTIGDSRKRLPMYQFRDDLLAAISSNQILIIVAETGSGKSTQVPQYLAESGYAAKGSIAITQPRRVAAMSVAKRVAEEVGCKLGKEVGYSIRFEDKSSPDTVIKFVTDGILLKELESDPLLEKYSVVMIDEAHERSLNTDIALALLLDLSRARPDLKLLIASATINAAKFSAFFDGASVFNVPGRTFVVDVMHSLAPEANYLSAAVTTVLQVHVAAELPGDLLVFLTGEEEIVAMQQSLEETARKLRGRIKELIICPIYSALPSDVQAKVFEPTPPNTRKVVLSTNIAETSITIDGVVHVIDSGFCKENVYNPVLGMESLVVNPISRASANQRAGRAGRTSKGYCYRLYTRWSFLNEMAELTEPEILRANLDSVVLRLKALGIHDLINFNFVDPPPTVALMKSLESLYAQGALDSTGALTRLGRRMSELPLDLKMAKAILESEKYGCRDEILSIVAVLGESSLLFFRPKDQKTAADACRAAFTSKEGGDMLTYLNIWNQFVESGYDSMWAKSNFLQYRTLVRARDIRDQLERLADRVEVPPSSCGIVDHIAIRKALTAGFFTNAARLQRDGQSYRALKNGLTVHLHPSSVLIERKPRWIVYGELVLTSKEFMRSALPIEPEWLIEVAPHFHKPEDVEALGTSKKMGKGHGKVGTDR